MKQTRRKKAPERKKGKVDPSVAAIKQWFDAAYPGRNGCYVASEARALLKKAVRNGWTMRRVWAEAVGEVREAFESRFGSPPPNYGGSGEAIAHIRDLLDTELISPASRKALEADMERLAEKVAPVVTALPNAKLAPGVRGNYEVRWP